MSDHDSFEAYSLVICSLSFSLWAFVTFSHDLTEIMHFCQEYHRRYVMCAAHIRAYMMLIYFIYDVNLDCLTEVVSTDSLPCKVNIFLFVIDKYLGGENVLKLIFTDLSICW
jgi:hypothetical protein